MSLNHKKFFNGVLPFFILVSFFFLPIQPAFSKKMNVTKVLSEIARSCREIDLKVKAGAVQGTFWGEVKGDPNGTRWVSFGTGSNAEKADPKGFWRSAQVYMDGDKVVFVEMEIKTPTKEWVQKIGYYFRQDGTLEKAHSDFRTFGAYERKKGPEHEFLAKVLRDRFYDTKGKCIKKSPPRIINTSNHREVRDVEFTDGAWPTYLHVSGLPFSGQLGPIDPKKSK